MATEGFTPDDPVQPAAPVTPEPAKPISYHKARRFAQEVAGSILDDPRTRQVIREVVLRTVIEMEAERELGHVRAFLASCDARRIRIWIDDAGELKATNQANLGGDLRAVLTLYREQITAHLIRQRELERLAEKRRKTKP